MKRPSKSNLRQSFTVKPFALLDAMKLIHKLRRLSRFSFSQACSVNSVSKVLSRLVVEVSTIWEILSTFSMKVPSFSNTLYLFRFKARPSRLSVLSRNRSSFWMSVFSFKTWVLSEGRTTDASHTLTLLESKQLVEDFFLFPAPCLLLSLCLKSGLVASETASHVKRRMLGTALVFELIEEREREVKEEAQVAQHNESEEEPLLLGLEGD